MKWLVGTNTSYVDAYYFIQSLNIVGILLADLHSYIYVGSRWVNLPMLMSSSVGKSNVTLLLNTNYVLLLHAVFPLKLVHIESCQRCRHGTVLYNHSDLERQSICNCSVTVKDLRLDERVIYFILMLVIAYVMIMQLSKQHAFKLEHLGQNK